MPPEISVLDSASSLLKAYSFYCSLIRELGNEHLPEQALGGKLLYAGELDDDGGAIAIAGNIAGCATLAAAADPDAQKRIIRDGIVDFLVTSLDEALRILKNEVRKHSTVAVAVGQSPHQVEREMLERGVQPDLTRDKVLSAQIDSAGSSAAVWRVDSSPAKWLPRLDAIALDCLGAADPWTRRWIRLSPRYLARVSLNQRALIADRDLVLKFLEKVHSAFDRGEVGTAATIRVISANGTEEYFFPPPQKS